jgi:hypothetical protein
MQFGSWQAAFSTGQQVDQLLGYDVLNGDSWKGCPTPVHGCSSIATLVCQAVAVEQGVFAVKLLPSCLPGGFTKHGGVIE